MLMSPMVFTTQVDIMMGSGLKYVHATKRSRQPGLEADLEKCRKQVSNRSPSISFRCDGIDHSHRGVLLSCLVMSAC